MSEPTFAIIMPACGFAAGVTQPEPPADVHGEKGGA